MGQASASTNRSVAKAAGFVMIMIFISRFIGFIREMLSAKIFGRGAATDAFFAAFTIPDVMYYLLVGGALSSAFIPVFTEYLAKDQEKEGWEAASTFINVALILLASCTILGVIFAPVLAPLVAYDFKGARLELLIKLMRFMFPGVFCTAVAGLQMGILNSYRHFFAPTMGPIVYNIGIIFGAVVLGHRYGVAGMAAGVVIGACTNVLTQFPFVFARNKGYKLKIDLSNPGYRRMIRLMLPTLIGLSVTQINLVINQNFASGLSEGSITALRYANRLMQLPLGIFAMGISQAIFPTLTRQVASGAMDSYKRTFTLGIRGVFFITLPAAVGLIVLRVPLVKLLFQHGAFTYQDTLATSVALAYYSIGLLAASTIQVMTRVFYAIHDTATPVKTGIAMVVLNFFLNLGFIRFTHLDHAGLALAFSIDGTVNMLLLLYILNRKIGGYDIKALAVTISKGLLAALAMGVVVYFTSRGISNIIDVNSLHNLFIQVMVSVAVGGSVYGMAAYLMKMEEVGFVFDLVKRRLKRS